MTDKSNIRKILGYLKYKIDMGFFENRKIFQKKVYLIKSLVDTSLNYNFSWYIHGPYSSDLADFGYANNNIEFEDPISFTPSSELISLKELFEKHGNDSAWFEVAASLIYIRNDIDIDKKNDLSAIILELKKRKPHLNNILESQKGVNLDEYAKHIWSELLTLIN